MKDYGIKKSKTVCKVLFFAITLLVASCASTVPKTTPTTNSPRKVASMDKDISGTFLAVSKYASNHVGPDKAATRVYFHEVEGEKGVYHAVLLEYYSLQKIGPSYVVSGKMPALANKIGYLKNITSKISAYKVFPTEKEGTYEMYPLVVQGDQIVEKRSAQPRILNLSNEEGLSNPLQGAVITGTSADDPEEIFFPKDGDDEKSTGIQYKIAKFIYQKAKLESTWRKSFLPGPYLSQYVRKSDVVLQLSGVGDNQVADFKINKAFAGMAKEKRKAMFTNEKSAFLQGQFSVNEPLDGMFLLKAANTDDASNEILKNKIGLFIDIFDATKSLNQDVVELAFIDSENPTGFLMYYEHPDNGEGK